MQPWATLIVHGFKSYETRSWVTQHRGPLLIQASRRFDLTCRNIAAQDPFATCLRNAGYKSVYDLPLGKIVGIVNIADSFPVEQIAGGLDSTELQFGNYNPGRHAWLLLNPRVAVPPIPCNGKLGIFDVPAAALEQVCKVFPEMVESGETQQNHTP
jgi:hypothetical protein